MSTAAAAVDGPHRPIDAALTRLLRSGAQAAGSSRFPVVRTVVDGIAPVASPEPRMQPAKPASVEQALARLMASIAVLEVAAARRLEVDRSKGALETELALMQDDRARLAVELDGALARGNRLEATTEDLARRIDKAIGSVRSVLDAAGTD